ncbi:MAG: HYR domain-containing protein, partial [Bacteroidales bacterium]|nr:HYR domain-containing protein [Bacteroidales bacterium]
MKRIIIVIFVMLSAYSMAIAQEATYNNYTGDWIDDASWQDGSSPGYSVNGVNLDISGYITINDDFDFNNGLITIHDTVIVYGNFTLLNNGDLTLDAAGILIIFGDYLSYNQVQISTGGTFVVTGEFGMLGSDTQGSFDNSGSVYIFDDDPDIKTGDGYDDLQCPDPNDYPDNCGYGNVEDIEDNPINDFFEDIQTCDYDTQEPVISGCPADINQGTDVAGCNAAVTWTEPTAYDNCDGAMTYTTRSHAPGATFNAGTTTVT